MNKDWWLGTERKTVFSWERAKREPILICYWLMMVIGAAQIGLALSMIIHG